MGQMLCVVYVCNDVKVNFGLVKFGVFCGNDEIVYYCKFIIIIQCIIGNSGDDRFVSVVEMLVFGCKEFCIDYFDKVFFCYFGDIGICGKCFFIVDDYDCLNFVVCICSFQCVIQFVK